MHQTRSKNQLWQKILMSIFPLIAIWGGYSLYAVIMADDKNIELHPAQSIGKSSPNQQTASQSGRKYKLISSECNSAVDECGSFTALKGVVQFHRSEIFVETLNTIQFIPQQKDLEIATLSAQIEGVNMFMGKVPVTFNAESGSWLGKVFLGMCGEREMLWQMKVTAVLSDGTQQVGRFRFTSLWPE